MLAIKRNYGDAIRMTLASGEKILIIIENANGRCVKACIEAPDSVRIERNECDHEERRPKTPPRRQAKGLEGLVPRRTAAMGAA